MARPSGFDNSGVIDMNVHSSHNNFPKGKAIIFSSPVKIFLLLLCSLLAVPSVTAQPARAQNLSFEDIEKLPKPPADHRIAYGSDPSQFGDLRLPRGNGPHPVVIIIHGGCWYSKYDLNHMASFCDSVTRLGVATWNLEYRRVGQAGGGWPGTFADVARGTDYLRVLAPTYSLNLKRVIAMGHSSGGQLALWLAARVHLPKESPLYSTNPLPLQGIVSLAGITDLRKYRPHCGEAVRKLLGGSPQEVPLRYQQASPIELLPIKVAQRLIHGSRDRIVPVDLSKDYKAMARTKGDDARLTIIAEADHFELIASRSSAWTAVKESVHSLLKLKKSRKRI